MTRQIRLRYTGLVVFASRVFSVLTGLIFVTMVTRNLSVADFGIWQYISLLLSYAVFPHGIVNYWATRYVARKLQVAKTGLILNIAFSLLGLVALLLISPYAAETINANPTYFFIGSFTILAMYTMTSLEASAYGCAPEIAGYGSLVFEITKVLSGFVILFHLRTGLYGVIVSVLLAYTAQTIFLLVSLRGYVAAGKINWKIAKKWLRMGWIPIYSNLAPFLASFGALIVTLLTSSSQPIALWNAALMIAAIIGYSSVLASALYPKLLAGGDRQDVETSFKLVLMFAVPSVIGAVTLAEPLLRIFRYEYDVAANILRISALPAFLGCIGNLLNTIVAGTEKVDMEEASFRQLLKSRLFILPTISCIYVSIYLPSVYIVTTIFMNSRIEPIFVNIPLAVNLIAFLFSIPGFIYTYNLAKRVLPFRFPLMQMGKYILASIPLAAIMILFYPHTSIQTIALVSLGAIIYFLTLFAIDKETRDLVNSILATFKLRRGEKTT